jgi:hypothetical protein
VPQVAFTSQITNKAACAPRSDGTNVQNGVTKTIVIVVRATLRSRSWIIEKHWKERVEGEEL